MSARSSPTSITLIAVTRALFSWRRFSHEGARRSRVAVQVWPWFETPGPNSQRPDQPSPELRPGVWLHGARTSERFRDRRRVCRDEFLCSRSWHAWRHPRRKLDFGSFEPASGFSSSDRATVAYGSTDIFLSGARPFRRLCRGHLFGFAGNRKQHLALSLNPLAPLLRRSG